MATLKQVLDAARELDSANDRVDNLQSQKGRLQGELAQVNTDLDAAKIDRDGKKNAFKTLVASLA